MTYTATRIAKIRRAKMFYAEVMSRTICAHCKVPHTERPLDWHSPDHALGLRRRVNKMVSVGFSVEAISAEMNRCIPLCRTCHMREDGRLAALIDNGRISSARLVTEPTPCVECDRIVKPTRRGLCASCYDKWRISKLAPMDVRYKGVRRVPSGRWIAYGTVDRHQVIYGTYDTAEEAKQARESGAQCNHS